MAFPVKIAHLIPEHKIKILYAKLIIVIILLMLLLSKMEPADSVRIPGNAY